jgi:hypothetical protein
MTLQDPINLDILRVGWGIVTASVLRHPVASASYRKRLWGLSAVLAVLALGGLRTWMRNPTMGSWLSFGSLFQVLFNLAVVGVLLLRYKVHTSRRSAA